MTAELLLRNGKIALLDRAGRFATALAVRGGRIIATGDDAALASLTGPETETVDLEGRTVIPGIVDSHCHPDSYAIRLLKWQALGPDRIGSKSQLLQTIADTARTLPQDRWFIGYRFNEQRSGGYPTIGELDAASGGRPVLIMRTCGHLALVNSAAFKAAGVFPDAEDPPFGRFDRDPASGAFTGLVRETAAHLFLGQNQDTDTPEDIARGMDMVFAECLSLGITSLYNSLTSSKAIRAYQLMKQRGRLLLRMGIIASGREDDLIESLIRTGIESGFGDDWLRVIGVEWCPDCSTSGRTAAYYEPYVGQRALGEPEENRGMLLYEAEDLNARATAAHKAGLLVCIEGVGDRGIDFALDAIEAALTAHPVPDHRMRVEHCCYVTPAIRERMRRLGAVDSSATGFMYDLGDAYIANRGPDAMRHMWPHRTLIDQGIPAPGHSDAAVCQFNPFLAMWSMVNRKTATGQSLDPREAVTSMEALRAYTTLGAWSGREEASKGSLEPGKLADFAVLDRDYFTIDPDEIREVRVLATYVGGVCRYRG
ncbi:MAG: amidohydrolase [Alphaproteobacteria bacterium]